jgi:hypothetical protein
VGYTSGATRPSKSAHFQYVEYDRKIRRQQQGLGERKNERTGIVTGLLVRRAIATQHQRRMRRDVRSAKSAGIGLRRTGCDTKTGAGAKAELAIESIWGRKRVSANRE